MWTPECLQGKISSWKPEFLTDILCFDTKAKKICCPKWKNIFLRFLLACKFLRVGVPVQKRFKSFECVRSTSQKHNFLYNSLARSIVFSHTGADRVKASSSFLDNTRKCRELYRSVVAWWSIFGTNPFTISNRKN